MNAIFDSHAHYDDKMFDDDRDSLLNGMQKQGVEAIVNCGVDLESSQKSIELANKYNFIWAAVGIYPHQTSALPKDYIYHLNEFLKNERVLALGEIGLDYHYDFSSKDFQKRIFDEQLSLAKETNTPVIIHDREAHEDVLNALKCYKPSGVIHCFSGSMEMAKDIIKLGMYIGVGGAVTFKNAKKLPDIVKHIPIENILLETDCPYMTPVPFRGKRCDSSYIKFTAEKIADIKGMSVDEVRTATALNASRLFSISCKEVQ